MSWSTLNPPVEKSSSSTAMACCWVRWETPLYTTAGANADVEVSRAATLAAAGFRAMATILGAGCCVLLLPDFALKSLMAGLQMLFDLDRGRIPESLCGGSL